MKARKDFILRNLVGEYLLMPVGDNIGRFRGTLLMNEMSVFVWEKMQESVSRDELLREILNHYEIDEKTAAADLDGLLDGLKRLGVIEDDDLQEKI